MEVTHEQLTGTDGVGPVHQGVEAGAPQLPRLLDIEGVAEVLGVTVRHVRRLVAERRIPFLKWGHYLRFHPNDIAAWIEAAAVTQSPPERSTRPAAARGGQPRS